MMFDWLNPNGMMVLGAVLITFPCWGGDVAGGLEDPTQPYNTGATRWSATTVKKKRAPLTLQSIVISPERRYAMINGKRVAIGETIDGGQVLNILPYEVVVRRGTRTESLPMLPRRGRYQLRDVETRK